MKPSPMSRSPGTCRRSSHRHPDRGSQSLAGLVKKKKKPAWRIASPIRQARLQLGSSSKGNPKNSTLGERRHVYEHSVPLCVWKANTPLHCFSAWKAAEAMTPFAMDKMQIAVPILVKCRIAPLQWEQCSLWWASIKISGMPYGFVNIWNTAEDARSPSSLHLNKEKCSRSDAYFSFL